MDLQNVSGDPFLYFMYQLSTPLGLVLVVGFAVLLIAVVLMPFLRWAYLGLAMWTSTLSFYGWARINENVLVQPLQQIRNYGRAITVAFLVALLIPSLVSIRGIRGKLTCGGLWLLGIYQMVFTARLAINGDYVRGYVGGLVLLTTFLVMVLGVCRWLQTTKDVDKLLKTYLFCIALFVVSNVVQVIVNKSAVIGQNRFYGTTGNPQHAGLVLAMSLVPLLYFAHGRGHSRLLRLLAVLLLIPVVGLMAWTGSRTAALVALISLGIIYRWHLIKFAVILPILVVGFYLTMHFSDTEGFAAHWLETTDTRSNVWSATWQGFLQNPLYGQAAGAHTGYAENSYLTIAYNFGVVGVVPLLLMVIATGYAMYRVWQLRPHLGPQAPLAEMVVAGLVSLLIGAFFEGYLAGTLTLPIYVLYLYLCLIPFLIDLAQRQVYAVPEGVALTQDELQYAPSQPQVS